MQRAAGASQRLQAAPHRACPARHTCNTARHHTCTCTCTHAHTDACTHAHAHAHARTCVSRTHTRTHPRTQTQYLPRSTHSSTSKRAPVFVCSRSPAPNAHAAAHEPCAWPPQRARHLADALVGDDVGVAADARLNGGLAIELHEVGVVGGVEDFLRRASASARWFRNDREPMAMQRR